MKRNVLLSSISIILVLGLVPIINGYSAEHIGCANQTPTLSLVTIPTAEWDYDAILTVDMDFEKCIKDGSLPKMPLMYEVELIDTEFNAVLETQKIISTTNSKFEIEYSLYEDIPYCVNIVATWNDKTTTSMNECWEIETNWATTISK